MRWMSNSYWRATAPAAPEYPPLQGSLHVDVAIVGAGITGLTAAMHLRDAGVKVALLEAGKIGAGTTGGTSAHLDVMPDQGARSLIDSLGKSQAQRVTTARAEAIGQIEAWGTALAADCELQRIPAYLFTESQDGLQDLESECAAARELGVDAGWTDAIPLPFPVQGGFQIERQARFHPHNYVQALARHLHGGAVTIFENTRVEPPETKGSSCSLRTPAGTVSAGGVLLCTHSAYLGKSTVDMRVAPYQSYVLVARVEEDVPDALFWDDAQPYHYLRRASNGDPKLLVIGGADHKTGQADERVALANLERYARERFTVRAIEHRWSAEFFEPADGLPYIGCSPSSELIYLATGYSGTGLTYGTLAGRLLADLVLGRDAPLAGVFSPTRFHAGAEAKKLITENANVARHFLGDRLTAARIESLGEVAAGEGRLVRYRGEALALYRDDKGDLHAMSPVCTHLGCFVQWNNLERTWDCPCHGGRYSPTGERLYGPPPSDLGSKNVADLPSAD